MSVNTVCIMNADINYRNLSQYLTNLMHKIYFTVSFILCLYLFRTHMLIIRRSTFYYTASGMITHIGGSLVHETATYMCVIIPEAV